MLPNLVNLDQLTTSWTACLLTALLVYLLLVRVVRYGRARRLERKYAPLGRGSFRDMSAEDAHNILKTLAELEFPTLYGVAMVVALFRVSDFYRSSNRLKTKIL